MPKLRTRTEMEAFVRTAELGSFSAASRELALSPSALSKFVKRLEMRLGIRLLNRTTRSVSVTQEGARLLPRCRRILEEMETAENEVMAGGAQPVGRLTMTVGVGFGMYQFLPILPDFLSRYPQVTVDLRIEDREVDLVKEGIDVAVRLVAPHDSRLGMRKLCDVERVLCASRRYLRQFGTPRMPEDLENHNCIASHGLTSAAPWSFEHGKKMISVGGNITVNSADAMLRLALMGKGIIRMNEMVVGKAIGEGRLVSLLVHSHDPQRTPLYAAYPAGREKVPRIAAMIQYLAESFRQPPWGHEQIVTRNGSTSKARHPRKVAE